MTEGNETNHFPKSTAMNCRSLNKRITVTVLLVTAWTTSALCGQESLTGMEEDAMRSAVRHVAPSVVRIETLGGVEQFQGKLLGSGPATGLIVSEDGYILSSAFAFVSQPSSILVTLPSGKRTSATIVARDKSRMLVLLKASTDEKLPVPTVVSRDKLQVGQWTLAVGRTYPGEFPNISVGILSAVNRIWGKAVQTDAKISPSNYGGPLIDIRGNVIGILVPLSPQRQGEMAGAEWYDSGIGFAIPLADIMPRLDEMKQGTDLLPGIMGVSFRDRDIYSTPPVIAACMAKSPAREAGLQVGDTIVEVDGVPIQRQAQLRHLLGPKVAGETIRVVVERGEEEEKERIEVSMQLVAELEPYIRPEIGILPMRETGDQAGVTVRATLPDSPAAQARLQRGDRIVGLDETDIADTDALREAVIAFDPGAEITLRYVRGDEAKSATIKLAPQSTVVPESLPPAHAKIEPGAGELPATGVVEIQIPEVANKCVAYVPETYNPAHAYGMLVWLHAPGSFDQEELIKLWKPLCEAENLILVAPQSADVRRWTATEIEFIRKAMDEVLGDYSIDSARVVLHGYLAGAAMAYHVAFGNRDICRGVAPVGSPLPMRIGTPATDPMEPLAIYSWSSASSRVAEQIAAGEEKLQEKKFPVLTATVPGPERYLNSEELAKLIRWIDTLDRI